MVYTQEGVIKDSRPWAKMFIAGATAIALAVGMIAQTFAASTTYVTPSSPNGWAANDVRFTGVAQINEEQADKEGNPGSLNLSLTNALDTKDKAGYLLTENNGGVNDVSALSFDWYRDSSSTAAGHFTPAVGVYVADNSGNSWLLKWEGVYNGYPIASGSVPTDQWVSENLKEGNFWRIPQTVNGTWVGYNGCNEAGDPYECFQYDRKLSDSWLSSFDIVALDVSVGSGWNGTYNSYVDNVTINEKNYNFELTAPDEMAPSVPQNLGWTSPAVACGGTTSSYTITANWDDSTDASNDVRYRYEVTTPNQTWTDPVLLSQSSRIGEFNDGEGTYTYRVQAVDAAGNESEWSADCSVTYDATPQVLGSQDCKNGGYMGVYTKDNKPFKNQGACVSYVNASTNASFKRGEQ